MSGRRGATGIAVFAIGLIVLLVTPRPAPAQDVREAKPATPAPDDALRPVSWFSWDGTGVHSNDRWAWRQTGRLDWQAYFRCRMGYGTGGFGWAPYPLGWLRYPRSAWGFGIGNRMYPPDPFGYAWDVWHVGSRGYLGFGSYGWSCFDPFGWSPFLMAGWGVGPRVVRYPAPYSSPYSVMYDLGERVPPFGISNGWHPGVMISGDRRRSGFAPPAPSGLETTAGEDEASPRAFIDPVRRESLDRNRWIRSREASGAVPISRKTPDRVVEPVRSPPVSRRGTLRPETLGSKTDQKVGVARPRKTVTPRPDVPRTAPRLHPQPVKTAPAPKTGGKTKPER